MNYLRDRRPERKASFIKSFLLLTGLLALATSLCGVAAADADSPLLPDGTYRLEMRTVSRTKVHMMGWNRSAMVSVSLVQLHWNGSLGVQSHQVCSMVSEREGAVVKLVFPQEYVDALSKPRYGIQIAKNGRGWEYRADLGQEHVGYLPDRTGGELPSSIDDPAIYDWDGDQRPGATLRLSIPLFPDGKLYVLQRGHQVLKGKVLSPGRVEGKIDVRLLEQKVIGAKPNFLNRTPEVIPESDQSTFSLTQIPAESSCESLQPIKETEVKEDEDGHLSD